MSDFDNLPESNQLEVSGGREELTFDPRLQSIGELDLESQLQVFEEIHNDLKTELSQLDNL
jgi:hypothetical protein